MAQQKTNQKDKTHPDGHKPVGSIPGVVEFVGQKNLPQEFITAVKEFDDALARCSLLDDNQLSKIIMYKWQLELFHMTDEIRDLTSWLNGRPAIGGFNRSLAAMAYTGIYVPEGAGVKVSKDTQKALTEINRLRNLGKGRGDEASGKEKEM